MVSSSTPLLVFSLLFLGVSWHASQALEPFACNVKDEGTRNLPFCQVKLPIQDRVRDLIGRLTLSEKFGLLVNNAAAVSRLGINRYEWWSEALHGVSNVGPGTKFGEGFPGATSFPQVITTAASFNATLWEAIGRVMSDEARAMYNGGMARVTYWSPNVNIFRDPRWGRGQETPGEDPLVVGTYASRYVRGLQENQGDRLKVAACCLDLDCGPFLEMHTEFAVKRGLLSEADINVALLNTLTIQMRLGMFDGEPSAQPYRSLGPKDVCNPAHQGLAIEAARQGIVLLNNHGPTLALSTRRHRTIAIIGPNSNVSFTMIGNYAGRQQELVSKVAIGSSGPTILVLTSGGPIYVSFAMNDPKISAILWAGYPGQAGEAAIADVLFGTTNPGKLPMAWYPQDYITNLPMTEMAMRSSRSKGYPGRTYRFYKGKVVYPFGHGLSYAVFVHTIASAPGMVSVPLDGHRRNYRNTTILGKAISVTHRRCNRLSLGIEVDVKNVGSKDGTDTLLVYSKPPAVHVCMLPQRHNKE
ncbi:hypothetical protein GH714_037882 [Hevea brasiliensis]|uniref:Fibronectin type III-like domain-containing protein n=1 Tax=Hevea brasiliensis TaxID=3981 RepID=A0A6A6LXL4_HEVBR|nr:hypothetical protein GH714_037882 [Hevea brasiliensis]